MQKKIYNEKIDLDLGMESNNTDNELDKDNSNIFDDFESDTHLIEEVNKVKKEKNKDIFYYLLKVGKVLSTIFWFLVIILSILYIYIYIQNDTGLKKVSLLDPICPIILGENYYNINTCASISALNQKYIQEEKDFKSTQANKILSIIEDLYNVVNFTETRKVLFLLNKSEQRLDVLNVLNEFNKIKIGFEKRKDVIQCLNIVIDGVKKTLSMTCTTYSGGFEKLIKGFDGTDKNTISGTSISNANSFLNYIEKQSEFFTLINRQKLFSANDILGEKTSFTNSSTFRVELLYKDISN